MGCVVLIALDRLLGWVAPLSLDGLSWGPSGVVVFSRVCEAPRWDVSWLGGSVGG